MIVELTKDGFERISVRIDEVQKTVDEGIINPVNALHALREARSELFKLRETLRDTAVISPGGSPGSDGPEAA